MGLHKRHPTDFRLKPKVSRFVIFHNPAQLSFQHLLQPQRYQCEEEPLGIVTEIAAIIFLVSLTDFLSFISKHGIDLTDMHLNLCGHPLAFFGKQFLNLLPVSIIDIYCHL